MVEGPLPSDMGYSMGPEDKEAAYQCGRDMFNDGYSPDDCPYQDTKLRSYWARGYKYEAEQGIDDETNS